MRALKPWKHNNILSGSAPWNHKGFCFGVCWAIKGDNKKNGLNWVDFESKQNWFIFAIPIVSHGQKLSSLYVVICNKSWPVLCPFDTVVVWHQSHNAARGLPVIRMMQLLHYCSLLLLHRAANTLGSSSGTTDLAKEIEIYRPNKFPNFSILKAKETT